MKGTTIAAAIILVGLLVLFAGPLLLARMPAQTYWSDEDQAAYEKASTEAHAAAFGGQHDHSQPHSHEMPADSEAEALRLSTRAEFERHQVKLLASQSKQKWLSIAVRVLGLVLAAGGVLLFIRARRAESA